MPFCCSARGDGSKVHLRLLGCSAFVAAWLFLSVTWLRYVCLGGSHPFQVEALQACPGQTNRSSFVHSAASGYQCYGPAGVFRAPAAPCTAPHKLKTAVLANLISPAGCQEAILPAEPTEAVIVSIYEGLSPVAVEALRHNRAAYAEHNGYRCNILHCAQA